jgi:regulator of sigma E protease
VQIATVYAGPQRRITYSVAEALGLGVRQSLAAAAGFVNAVVHIVRGELSLRESVGGPIRIAELASQQAELGVVNFLTFLALLSVTLAVINLLPLPALDGGHLVVVLLEGLLRRELPVRFKLALQQVGVVLLVALMVLVLLNDLRR